MYNKSYQVQSLPIKDVIRDLSRQFQVSLQHDCDKYWIKLPEGIGQGQISGIAFGEGLAYLEYDCTFHHDTKISFSVNDIHPLKFIYCTRGSFKHTFENTPETYSQVNRYQHIIVASCKFNGHILTFAAQEKINIISLEINRQVFLKDIQCSIHKENASMRKLFSDVQAQDLFLYEGSYSYSISEIVEKIKCFKDKNLLESLFLKSKSYEILTEQILLFRDDQKSENKRSVLRRSELEKIKKAAAIIQSNIDANYTVNEIAASIGMSVSNVQAGFKAVFNTTVNAYMKDIRLQLAKDLLVKSEMTISEIVYEVGLNNKSYFSKIFKEQYEITPSEFRNIHLNS